MWLPFCVQMGLFHQRKRSETALFFGFVRYSISPLLFGNCVLKSIQVAAYCFGHIPLKISGKAFNPKLVDDFFDIFRQISAKFAAGNDGGFFSQAAINWNDYVLTTIYVFCRIITLTHINAR